MRLTVLADNRTDEASLKTEHGLCVHMDAGRIKVLLDTGASDSFIVNASALGIDLAEVDYVFVSHGHRDHAGGLAHLLKLNRKAKVIVSSEALRGSFHSSRNGMHVITPEWPFELMEDRLISVEKETEIAGMRIIPSICHRHPLPKANRCLYTCNVHGEYVHDEFGHEMVLEIDGFLFTGCAHNGLMNIMESSHGPVHTVLGGFHLLDASPDDAFEGDDEIGAIASALHSKYPDTVFYTGHCTGDKAYHSMKHILGHNLMQFRCGMSLTCPRTSPRGILM